MPHFILIPPKLRLTFVNLEIIFLKSFLVKSGHNLLIKKISVYDDCHNKKLLSLFLFPVLIKISGSGIFAVYKCLLIFFSEIGIDNLGSYEIFDSEFDYKNNVLLSIPSNMPEPNDPNYTRSLVDLIYNLSTNINEKILVLFTSYSFSIP